MVNLQHVMTTFAVSSSRSGSNYNVRIYNRKTAERTLLKGFSGRVVDISFAFASAIVLGIVDEVGGLFVYDVTETAEGKITYLFLHCIDVVDIAVNVCRQIMLT